MKNPNDYKKPIAACMGLLNVSYLVFALVVYRYCGGGYLLSYGTPKGKSSDDSHLRSLHCPRGSRVRWSSNQENLVRHRSTRHSLQYHRNSTCEFPRYAVAQAKGC